MDSSERELFELQRNQFIQEIVQQNSLLQTQLSRTNEKLLDILDKAVSNQRPTC